jgi:hypothetical protein
LSFNFCHAFARSGVRIAFGSKCTFSACMSDCS